MTTETKYPNANTLPERLTEIVAHVLENSTVDHYSKAVELYRKRTVYDPVVIIYDLLAMLHEQRRRKISEKLPESGRHVQIG